MKRFGKYLTFFLFCLGLAGIAAYAAENMTVQVKEGQIRQIPSFLSPVTAKLNYGAQVSVVEKKDGWAKISGTGQAAGWMHLSALTSQKLELQAGAGGQTGASGKEVALAGKGFNSQVEGEYKKKNPKVDFTWIDRMEKITVSPQQSRDFLVAGKLKTF